MNSKSVNVWDPIVRIGHWTLVIAFFTAYFTEDDFMTQHVWAGYVVASVVAFRILWGFIGSRHARFSDFIYRPSAVFGYLKGLVQRKPQHYLGHNPAGGAMVIALLISLCGTAYSGMALYAVEENAGPLVSLYGHGASTVSENANGQTQNAEEKEEEEEDDDAEKAENEKAVALKAEGETSHEGVNEQDEEFWEGLHEFFANFTLLLVFLHIGGVVLSSLIDKENLVKAMITGRKDSVN